MDAMRNIATNANDNTALGYQAFSIIGTNATGNIAIGSGAGTSMNTGNKNIYIDNIGANENQKIRIGTTQVANYQAGIFGSTSAGAVPVVINAAGLLGTVVSLRSKKADITDMDEQYNANVINNLIPRSFYMIDDPTKTITNGLIVDEVEQIAPELIVNDINGNPATIHYDRLPMMLLKEIQRLNKEIEALKAKIN